MQGRPWAPSRLAPQLAAGFLAAVVSLTLQLELERARAEPLVSGGAPVQRGYQGTAHSGEPRSAAAPGSPLPRASAGGDRGSRRDPFAAMGGGSPFCSARGLDARERAHCRASGALSHPYEINRYGFDIHIDTGADNIAGNFFYAMQAVALLAWTGLTYLLKGVLLVLEWAFSLDLLSDTLAVVRRALLRLHRDVLGEPWFLAAISAAGLWGIYRGFVQGRRVQAAAGLAATVALMVCALVIINRPADTVGYASRLANQAGLAMVGGASSGSLDRPEASFGRATSRLFDHLVLRPWCALEFGDVEFCLSSPRQAVPLESVPDDEEIRADRRAAPSVADWWLRYEANGEDDLDQRERIYQAWRDSGGRLQDAVRIQKQGGTATRVAVLALTALGLFGAILLLGWLGLRLLGYGVLAVVLLLFAPVAFLAPALGDSGRATFLSWAKRLLGALVAKAVYGVFLAVVLVAGGALGEAYALGWLAAWGLQIVFWWSIFLKRNDLLEFVTAPLPEGARQAGGGGLLRGLQGLYYGRAALRGVAGGARAVASPATRPAAAAAGVVADWRRAGGTATQTVAEQTVRRRARERLEQRRQDAERLVDRDERSRAELNRVDRALRKYDERAVVARARGEAAPEPSEPERALLARRSELERVRPAGTEVRAAREQLRHREINRARTGEAVTERDERAWIDQRRSDRQRATSAADDDEAKQLALGASRADGRGPTRHEVRVVRATLPRDELRRARGEQFAANRCARRAARSRSALRPPKR
jgi:hypothetical protein